MKICIPTYKRAERQKTLEFFQGIGYDTNKIYLYTQTEEDFREYQKYRDICNIIYKPAFGVAQARNNILDDIEIGERIIMLDDDIEKIRYYHNGKWEEVTSAEEFTNLMSNIFAYCKTHKSHVFCVPFLNNLYFQGIKAQKNKYALNRLGGDLFGILKTNIRFDESFATKEDLDFLLAHMARGEDTVIANFINLQSPLGNKGGCEGLHNDETEIRMAEKLFNKYKAIVKINPKKRTEIQMRRYK